MRIVGIGLALLVFFVSLAPGQKRSMANLASKSIAACRSGQKLVDRNNPVVFLTFNKKERIETETRGGSDADYLFFTLTNNSCWPIWLDMSGVGDKRFGDTSLYAEAQDIESGRTLRGRLRCHVCSFNPLSPGKKLTFSVPFEFASRSSVMKVAFDFGWEKDAEVDGSCVLHTVNFYFSNLPDSVLPK